MSIQIKKPRVSEYKIVIVTIFDYASKPIDRQLLICFYSFPWFIIWVTL